jgi:hypothetical protein
MVKYSINVSSNYYYKVIKQQTITTSGDFIFTWLADDDETLRSYAEKIKINASLDCIRVTEPQIFNNLSCSPFIDYLVFQSNSTIPSFKFFNEGHQVQSNTEIVFSYQIRNQHLSRRLISREMTKYCLDMRICSVDGKIAKGIWLVSKCGYTDCFRYFIRLILTISYRHCLLIHK